MWPAGARALEAGDVMCNPSSGDLHYNSGDKDGQLVNSQEANDASLFCQKVGDEWKVQQNPGMNFTADSCYRNKETGKCQMHAGITALGAEINWPGKKCAEYNSAYNVVNKVSGGDIGIWLNGGLIDKDDTCHSIDVDSDSICYAPADLKKYRESWRSCWFCGPLNSIVQAVGGDSGLAKKSFRILTPICLVIMGGGMLLWICVYLLKQFSLTKGFNAKGWDLYKTIGSLLTRGIIACAIFAAGGEPIYNYFVVPAIGIASQLAAQINNVEGVGGVTGDAFQQLSAAVDGFMRTAAYAMTDIMAAGMAMIRHALSLGIFCLLPAPEPFFTGLLIFGLGFFLLMFFPFKLLGSLFELAIAAALMPMFLAAWAFNGTGGNLAKMTGKWVQAGVSFIMSIATTFLFSALSIFVVKKLLEKFFQVPVDNPAHLTKVLSLTPEATRDSGALLIGYLIVIILLVFIVMAGNLGLLGGAMSKVASVAASLGKTAAKGAKGTGNMMMGNMERASKAALGVPDDNIGRDAREKAAKGGKAAAGGVRKYGGKVKAGAQEKYRSYKSTQEYKKAMNDSSSGIDDAYDEASRVNNAIDNRAKALGGTTLESQEKKNVMDRMEPSLGKTDHRQTFEDWKKKNS